MQKAINLLMAFLILLKIEFQWHPNFNQSVFSTQDMAD